MDQDSLNSLDKETLIRLILSQAEAIERLTREVEALRAENVALRAKLDLPPKTPENSSTPPRQGHKVSGEDGNASEGKRRKSHAGAYHRVTPGDRCIPIRPRNAMFSLASANIAAPFLWIRRSSAASPTIISKSPK